MINIDQWSSQILGRNFGGNCKCMWSDQSDFFGIVYFSSRSLIWYATLLCITSINSLWYQMLNKNVEFTTNFSAQRRNLLNTFFKYWLFSYLNHVSPSLVVIQWLSEKRFNDPIRIFLILYKSKAFKALLTLRFLLIQRIPPRFQ